MVTELLNTRLKYLQQHHPFYMETLKGINMDEITTYRKFHDTIPILTKKDVFHPKHFRKFFPMLSGELIPSAGSSGNNFAYRFADAGSRETTDEKFQELLRYWFQDLDLQCPTLVLNAYPLGIKLSSGPFTMVHASAREDIILQTLTYTKKQFTNVLLIAQSHVIKYLLDNPEILKLLKGYDRNIYVISGGYWFPLSFEKQVCHKLFGRNAKLLNTHFRSAYGTAEAGLGLMIEPAEKVRYHFQGRDEKRPAPLLYQWDSSRVMLELVNHTLVYTALQESTPDLLRYQLGDQGDFLDRDQKPPALALYGRGEKCNLTGMVYSMLFDITHTADQVSGCFFIDRKHTLHIQLKRGVRNMSAKDIKNMTGLQTKIYTYENYPYHRELALKPKFE